VRPELPEALADQRPPRPPAPDGAGPPPAAGPWLPLPAWVPFATLGAAALALLLISGFVLALWPGLSADGDTPQGLVIALTVVQDAILVGAAVYAVRAVLGRVSPAMFGLRPTPVQTALTWIAIVYVGFWVASAIVLAIFGSPPDQEIVRELKDTEALDVLVGFAVLTCVVAPLAEEFFFRGFMFGALAARMGVAGGALVTGLVFGLIHLPGSPLVGVVVLSVLGVGLCVLYWKTGSLLPCLALHAAHNAFSFGLTKSLPALGVLGLVAGSVAVVLWVGWVAGARAAPAAAA
jgi:membrane protease YdiL (CAAX protease family)